MTATESGVEGTGLGLAITKQLVDLHGGTIQVHSTKGKGSEFIVRLKFKIADEAGIPVTEDGARAVEMVANSTPGYYGLILIDIQKTPYMDGYQASREIHSLLLFPS